uniref:Uncharacterized protein n=1 Tax=Paramormyrops kingsleyae TaxID=1676925 RepID=A0A3B3SKJ0_9TELE
YNPFEKGRCSSGSEVMQSPGLPIPQALIGRVPRAQCSSGSEGTRSLGHNGMRSPGSPFLQRLSSISSRCTMSFRLRVLSFSFSYFLFHSSAVSSRFTDTVFLIVLALRRETGR